LGRAIDCVYGHVCQTIISNSHEILFPSFLPTIARLGPTPNRGLRTDL
jgi:hypothetical protein